MSAENLVGALLEQLKPLNHMDGFGVQEILFWFY